MSNCIDIVDNHEVYFNEDEMFLDPFMKAIAQVADLEESPSGDPVLYVLWWFVAKNYFEVCDKEGKRVIGILFGKGRSAHTQRDFYALLDVIAGFMKKSKKHRFILTNESDDFTQRYTLDVDFAVGRPR